MPFKASYTRYVRIKFTFPALFILSAALLFGGAAYLNQFSFSALIQNTETEQFKLMESIVRFNIKGTIGKALARAELLADVPAIRQALITDNRTQLLKETQTLFEHQNDKYGVAQLQFTRPPHTMFLRVQKPAVFGDDLSSFRHTVVATYAQKKNITGVEISRSGPAMFGVVPFKDRNTVLGTIEVGLDFAPMLDNLKSAYGFDLAFMVNQKMAGQTATLMNKLLLNPENTLGTYFNFHSTDWKRLRYLVNPDQLDNLKEVRNFTQTYQNHVYGVVIVPIQDFNGQTIGSIVAFKDFQASRSSNKNFLVMQLVLGILSVVLLAGIILVVLKGGLLQPLAELTEQLNALAEGNAEADVETQDYPADLQPLATAYQRLKARLFPGDTP
jgi:methyl-accepting chemotaxis protein